MTFLDQLICYNFIKQGQSKLLITLLGPRTQQYKQKSNMEDPIQQFKTWYTSQPVVTRTYLTGAFVLGCAISLGFISPYSLYYTFSLTFFELDLWRPITSLLFQGKFSFSFLFAMYFCYFGISRVETDIFNKDTFPDFVWLCVYLYSGLLILASLFNLYFIGDGFIFALMYIWCKRRPFETLTLMFGFQVKSGYFPWVYMGFQVLMGSSFYIYLAGLLFGHLYIAIKDIYLPRYHKDYLPTPGFIKRWLGGGARNQAAPGTPRNVFAGRGVRMQ